MLADATDTTPLDDKLDAAATAVWYADVIVRESLRFFDHEASLSLRRPAGDGAGSRGQAALSRHMLVGGDAGSAYQLA